MRFRPLLLGFVVLLFDCATLEPLSSQTCGNGVVDSDEDCDTFPRDATGRCGAAFEGDAACRLHCGKQSGGEVFTCPDGWGCSVKGVCRQPTGAFAPALVAVSAGVTNLAVGDFDGDRRADLIGTGPRTRDNASRVRVHFFNDLGALVEPIVSLPSQLVSPVVVDLDGNGRDDIAFGIVSPGGEIGGIGVMSGLEDRTFLPVVFPALTIDHEEAVPIPVLPSTDVELPNGGGSAILLFSRGAAGPALKSLDSEVGSGVSLRRDLPVGPEALRGRPLSARVHDLDPRSTCGEVVAPVDTAAGPRVLVVSPCTYVDGVGGRKTPRWENKAAIESLVVPMPFTAPPAGRGALLADWNGDGHLDLLVDTTGGVFLALGTGTGFAPFSPKAIFATMPLAAADLNGDGKVDYIFPTSVVTSTAADGGAPADAGTADGGYAFAVFQQQQAWSDAVVGHFNADEFFDVLMMRAGSPDLQLYAGGRAGLTQFTVNTDGIVQSIAAGDFDGDHVDDIAVAQARPVGGGSDLAIAYGRALGGPEPARLIGRVDTQQGIGSIPRSAGGLADLGVFSFFGAPDANGLRATSFTLLLGSGDRQTLAPLLLIDGRSLRPLSLERALAGQSRAWLPVGLAAGGFGDPTRPSILTYAIGITSNRKAGTFDKALAGAWVAISDPTAQGGLAAPIEVQQIDDQVTLIDPTTRAVTVATAARDVDNLPDKLTELLILANFPGSPDPGIQVVHPTSQQATSLNPIRLPGLQTAPGAQLDAIDVDGDGFRDAIGIFGTTPDSQLIVFLNDGKGSFVVPGIPLRPLTPVGASADGARAFASLTVGGARVFEGGARTTALVAVTTHSVLLATLRADKKGFDVTELLSGLAAVTGVAAGDFNGDGVDDIAFADGGSIRLIPQIPARLRP